MPAYGSVAVGFLCAAFTCNYIICRNVAIVLNDFSTSSFSTDSHYFAYIKWCDGGHIHVERAQRQPTDTRICWPDKHTIVTDIQLLCIILNLITNCTHSIAFALDFQFCLHNRANSPFVRAIVFRWNASDLTVQMQMIMATAQQRSPTESNATERTCASHYLLKCILITRKIYRRAAFCCCCCFRSQWFVVVLPCYGCCSFHLRYVVDDQDKCF